MNYKIGNNIIYVSLDPDDHIMGSLLNIANELNLKSGWISGIGAIKNILIGMYNIKDKKYNKKQFNNNYELVSFLGNVSLINNKSFIHAHIVFSDDEYKAFGGHLFEGIITVAGEFIITKDKQSIKRKMNNKIGLPLWCLKSIDEKNY